MTSLPPIRILNHSASVNASGMLAACSPARRRDNPAMILWTSASMTASQSGMAVRPKTVRVQLASIVVARVRDFPSGSGSTVFLAVFGQNR